MKRMKRPQSSLCECEIRGLNKSAVESLFLLSSIFSHLYTPSDFVVSPLLDTVLHSTDHPPLILFKNFRFLYISSCEAWPQSNLSTSQPITDSVFPRREAMRRKLLLFVHYYYYYFLISSFSQLFWELDHKLNFHIFHICCMYVFLKFE